LKQGQGDCGMKHKRIITGEHGQKTATGNGDHAELASVHEVLGSDRDPSKRLLNAAHELCFPIIPFIE
jgi:hypothetical protein